MLLIEARENSEERLVAADTSNSRTAGMPVGMNASHVDPTGPTDAGHAPAT